MKAEHCRLFQLFAFALTEIYLLLYWQCCLLQKLICLFWNFFEMDFSCCFLVDFFVGKNCHECFAFYSFNLPQFLHNSKILKSNSIHLLVKNFEFSMIWQLMSFYLSFNLFLFMINTKQHSIQDCLLVFVFALFEWECFTFDFRRF